MEFNDIWGYYLLLEEDFMKTIRYLELSQENYFAYSDEFIKQYLTIGSELDVEFKNLCNVLKDTKSKNICGYAATILNRYTKIFEVEVCVLTSNYKLRPFRKWNKSRSDWNANAPGALLSWWRSYNNVKHNRGVHKREANQKNVLNALSALYLLNVYIYKETLDTRPLNFEKGPSPRSKLFYIKNQNKFMLDES